MATLEAACLSFFQNSDFTLCAFSLDCKTPAAEQCAQHQLEVEVTNPVDYVKEQEGCGEKDPGVGIQLPDVDVDPASPPATFFTLLVAAEEAGAVFAIQTLIQAVVLVVVPEEGVAHRHHGSWGQSHGKGWVGLWLVKRRRIRVENCKPLKFCQVATVRIRLFLVDPRCQRPQR